MRGKRTGYWATPQPQMTAAIPRAATTRISLILGRRVFNRAMVTRPLSAATITREGPGR